MHLNKLFTLITSGSSEPSTPPQPWYRLARRHLTLRLAQLHSLVTGRFVKTGASFTTSDEADQLKADYAASVDIPDFQCQTPAFEQRDDLTFYGLGSKTPPNQYLVRNAERGFTVLSAEAFNVIFRKKG